jgi:hypothetical protein
MNREAYETALHMASNAIALIDLVPVPDILNAMERADAVGPILDPTLYRAKAAAMAQDREIMEALLPAWRLAQKIKAEAKR